MSKITDELLAAAKTDHRGFLVGLALIVPMLRAVYTAAIALDARLDALDARLDTLEARLDSADELG